MKPNRKINEEAAYNIIKTQNLGVISMIDETNRPYGVSINYAYDELENCLYFHTLRVGRKINALKINPNISMLIIKNPQIQPRRFITHYESVILEGSVSFIDGSEEKKDKLRFLCDQLCPGVLDRRESVIEQYLPALYMGKITIDHISGKKNHDD